MNTFAKKVDKALVSLFKISFLAVAGIFIFVQLSGQASVPGLVADSWRMALRASEEQVDLRLQEFKVVGGETDYLKRYLRKEISFDVLPPLLLEIVGEDGRVETMLMQHNAAGTVRDPRMWEADRVFCCYPETLEQPLREKHLNPRGKGPQEIIIHQVDGDIVLQIMGSITASPSEVAAAKAAEEARIQADILEKEAAERNERICAKYLEEHRNDPKLLAAAKKAVKEAIGKDMPFRLGVGYQGMYLAAYGEYTYCGRPDHFGVRVIDVEKLK